jgi:phenylpyruvate tautomerase PptA (4-oxalocrotonate tautomerase family)
MPVLFVADTQKRSVTLVRRMIRDVNAAVSETIEVPLTAVWTRYEPGNPAHYGEGQESLTVEGLPVLVIVRMVEGRDPKKLQRLFGAVSSAIAGAFDMNPEHVWMRLEEFHTDKVGQGARSYTEIRKKKR